MISIMLHIIFLILKIIGIALLVIIGTLLLLLIALLFIPVRYRFSMSYQDKKIYFDGTVSWLLHLIHTRIKKEDEGPHIWLRIFGIKIFDNLKKDKPKKNIPDRRPDRTKKVKKKPYKKKQAKKAKKVDENEIKVYYDEKGVPKPTDQEIEEKLTFMGKIKNKIKNIIDSIISFFNKIKNKVTNIYKKILDIKDKFQVISSFLRDEITIEGFSLIYDSLKKLFKHILPSEFNMKLLFGTGDPCSTGKVLGVLSLIYGLYGEHIEITPDFNNKVLEGNFNVKGRIRLVRIIIIVTKLLLDKRFKRLKNNFSRLKEGYNVR